MLTKYINNPAYDLANSFVIGDRITDVKLAQNLGAKGIFIANDKALGAKEIQDNEGLNEAIALKTTSWKEIYEFLKLQNRTASIVRNTNETKIKIDLNLDGTGIRYFDWYPLFRSHVRSNCASRANGFSN